MSLGPYKVRRQSCRDRTGAPTGPIVCWVLWAPFGTFMGPVRLIVRIFSYDPVITHGLGPYEPVNSPGASCGIDISVLLPFTYEIALARCCCHVPSMFLRHFGYWIPRTHTYIMSFGLARFFEDFGSVRAQYSRR